MTSLVRSCSNRLAVMLWLPSPYAGRGWGWGASRTDKAESGRAPLHPRRHARSTPPLTPPRQGEGNKVAQVGTNSYLGAGTALVAFLLVGSTLAFAQDEHSGITEYELACMPCHGIDGRGDGPRAMELSKPPADLTRITKVNGGKFPLKIVAEIIDGRAAVAGHGPRDMPVWGDRYRVQADAGESAKTVERRARGQIAALVRYLESIQEK